MMRFKFVGLWCLVVSAFVSANAQNVTENEIRPYEFTFNIVDFQHRSEKRDDDGLITGEYGFITADGIYHETAYATDKTGDFIITKMRHRKISTLKDAEEIFKDRPEQARMLAKALMKSCLDCDISELDRQETSSFVRAGTTTTTTTTTSTTPEPKKLQFRTEKKLDIAMKEMMKILHEKSNGVQIIYAEKYYQRPTESSSQVKRPEREPDLAINSTTNEIIRDMVDAAKRVLEISSDENEREEITSDEVLENMANDLFYRFNYTITSHGHWEDGFRDGRKDGEYNAKFREGVDTHVKYVSNEFGFQPNITLVARVEDSIINDDESNASVNYSNDRISGDNRNDTEVDRTPRIIYRERPKTTEKPYKGPYLTWFRK